MEENVSFRQILERKITEKPAGFEATTSQFDPTLYETFTPKTEIFHWKTSRAKRAYPTPKPRKVHIRPSSPQRKTYDPFLKRDQLDASVMQALDMLRRHSDVFMGDTIYLSDVKRAFRFSARKHHPDAGGEATTFMNLKKAYDLVLPQFPKENEI